MIRQADMREVDGESNKVSVRDKDPCSFKVIKKKGGKYQKDESRCEGKLECRCYERRWDTEVRLTEVRYELSFESCWQKATVQQDEERDFTFLPCGRVVLVYVNKILKSKILKLNKVK